MTPALEPHFRVLFVRLIVFYLLGRDLKQLIGLEKVQVGDDEFQGSLVLHEVGLYFP